METPRRVVGASSIVLPARLARHHSSPGLVVKTKPNNNITKLLEPPGTRKKNYSRKERRTGEVEAGFYVRHLLSVNTAADLSFKFLLLIRRLLRFRKYACTLVSVLHHLIYHFDNICERSKLPAHFTNLSV